MTRIMLVGEAFGEKEAEAGAPFVGPSGWALNGLLRDADIRREDCVVTNVFNFRPPGNDVEALMTRDPKLAAEDAPSYAPKMWLHRDYAMSLYELDELRRGVDPNCIVALGDTALWALTHSRSITKFRGTVMPTHDRKHKVLPTFHPAAVLRQWDLRPVVYLDLLKAKRQSEFPEIRRPERLIRLAPTLSDIAQFYYDHVRKAKLLSVDIETKAGQITEIGFATSPHDAIVIPFWSRGTRDGNYWATQRDEVKAWWWVRKFLAEKPSIGQNFQYDMTYLYRKLGIPVPGFIGDTMLLHHAMQPELKKSLGFLASIYTDEPAWKFMRKEVDTLKKED